MNWLARTIIRNLQLPVKDKTVKEAREELLSANQLLLDAKTPTSNDKDGK